MNEFDDLEFDSFTGSSIEESDDWLLTYGDMFTLLLVFFILIVASSEIKKEKLGRVLDATGKYMGMGFTGTKPPAAEEPGIISLPPEEPPEPKPQIPETAQSIIGDLRAGLKKEASDIKVDFVSGSITIETSAKGRFDENQARLSKKFTKELHLIYDCIDEYIINETIKEVNIEGFTDKRLIKHYPESKEYLSNWNLSSERASSVAAFFEMCLLKDIVMRREDGYYASVPIEVSAFIAGDGYSPNSLYQFKKKMVLDSKKRDKITSELNKFMKKFIVCGHSYYRSEPGSSDEENRKVTMTLHL